MSSRRLTVEEHGMRRLPAAFSREEVDFMMPLLTVPGTWKAYEVRGRSDIGGSDIQFSYYAVNIEAGGYCTFSLQSQDGQAGGLEVITKMEYRDMIIDNFAAAGGDPADIKALGTRFILNEVVRDSVKEMFEINKKDITKEGSVRLAANETQFNECATFQPFERKHECLSNQCAQHVEFVKASEFIAFSEGLESGGPDNGIDLPAYHLVRLFESPQNKNNISAVEDAHTIEMKKTLFKDAVNLIGDAGEPLKGAKDNPDGDQRIRDAIKTLDEAIHILRAAAI